MTTAFVAIGGMLGVLARYGLNRMTLHTEALIWTTVGINIAGSFLLGLLVAGDWFSRDVREGLGVGFLGGFTTFSTFLCKPGLYLEDVFVEPAHRGLGIGKAILRRLAGIAVERDYGRFEWRVLDWNERSIKFYESIGGDIMKEWWLVRMTTDRIAAFASA